jgi:hypothetical protein
MAFVHLNISGTAFQALKDTLLCIPLFEAFFANNAIQPLLPLFVDRDYNMFEEIYALVAVSDNAATPSKEITEEMMYYGLAADDEVTAKAKAKVEHELAILMESATQEFHVNACGKNFQTSKMRLMETPYFSAMFNGSWKEGLDATLGSKTNPVFVNIPPKQFKIMLQNLRCGITSLNTLVTPVNKPKDVNFWRPKPLGEQVSDSLMYNCVLGCPSSRRHCYLECKDAGFGKKVSIVIPYSIDEVKQMYCRFHVHNQVIPDLFAYKVIERVQIASNGRVINFTTGYLMWLHELLYHDGHYDNDCVPLHMFFTFVCVLKSDDKGLTF